MSDRKTAKLAIALDFDGVIHDYAEGWGDGEIRGKPTDRAFEVIRTLLERDYAVFIFSARRPEQIRDWLLRFEPFIGSDEASAIPLELIPEHQRFWQTPRVLGITDRKVPAKIYVDDRAHLFDTKAKPAEHCWQELLEMFL